MSDVTNETGESELEPVESVPDEGVADSLEVELMPDAAAAAVLAVGRDALRGVSDGLRRAMTAGVRTVLTADERLKDALPDELATYVARQTEAVKGEIVRAIGRQTRAFLDQVDLQKELRSLLEDMTIEVNTTVRLVPREDGAEAEGARVVFTDSSGDRTMDGAGLAPLVDSVLRALVREWTLEQETRDAGDLSSDDGDSDVEP